MIFFRVSISPKFLGTYLCQKPHCYLSEFQAWRDILYFLWQPYTYLNPGSLLKRRGVFHSSFNVCWLCNHRISFGGNLYCSGQLLNAHNLKKDFKY